MSSEPLSCREPVVPVPAPEDHAALLVRKHQRSIFAYLSSLGCPEGLVEDLTQETLVTALRGGHVDRGEAATRAWLRSVAKSRYLDHLRRNRRARRVDLDEVDAAWARFEGEDGGAAYLDALRSCLGGLADRARRGLELRYRDGRDRAQIAEAVGLSLGGVKSLLSRAKATLRECIERRMS